MSLRATQIELLRAVGSKYECRDSRRPGARLISLSLAVNRNADSVDESLCKLEERGYVEAVFYPLSSAVYRLTDKGREALEGEGQ